MQDNACRARRGGFKLNKALYLSLYFQPKLLQVASSKPSLSEKRSLIMVIKAGGVFLWRIWVTHIFHDSGGQFICLSSLPSIETSSERAPPPLPGNSCMLRERQRKRARKKKEGNKVEGWMYLFALGLDYQQHLVSLPSNTLPREVPGQSSGPTRYGKYNHSVAQSHAIYKHWCIFICPICLDTRK